MIDIGWNPPAKTVQIIIGVGNQQWPGRIPTDKEKPDLLNPED